MGLFFKNFDAFLNKCVDYLDYRILTGKFVEDINYYLYRVARFTRRLYRKIYFTLMRSHLFMLFVKLLIFIWHVLLKIPLFALVVNLIAETIRIIIKCYSEIFIIFAITFTTTILLLSWFQNAVIIFCFAFIPILLINIICVSALYYAIDRREASDKITIWESILFVMRHFRSIIFPALTEATIILESFVTFIIISLFLSYAFDLFKIPWSGSILYWFVVIIVGSLLFLGIFIMSLLAPQTYFAILLDHLPFHQALGSSKAHVLSNLRYYLLFYILLYSIFGILIWHAVLSSLYLGFTIGIYFAIASGTLLGFLLRKKFWIAPTAQENAPTHHKMYIFLNIFIFFGIINYVLLSVLLVKEYQPLLAFIQQQQNNYLASQQEKQYTNATYQYSLAYPGNWSVYQWQSNSVTFYNNYTATLTGGTWMTITISPYAGSTFNQLYEANPGVVAYDPQNKDIITKVTNTTIQGYSAVNYLFTKPSLPYTQYETHYLIHKGDNVYDISFTSVTNDVASYNNDLFTKIINSFKFTQ